MLNVIDEEKNATSANQRSDCIVAGSDYTVKHGSTWPIILKISAVVKIQDAFKQGYSPRQKDKEESRVQTSRSSLTSALFFILPAQPKKISQ